MKKLEKLSLSDCRSQALPGVDCRLYQGGRANAITYIYVLTAEFTSLETRRDETLEMEWDEDD